MPEGAIAHFLKKYRISGSKTSEEEAKTEALQTHVS